MKRFSQFALLVVMAVALTGCVLVHVKFCVDAPQTVKGYLPDEAKKLMGSCPLDFQYTNMSKDMDLYNELTAPDPKKQKDTTLKPTSERQVPMDPLKTVGTRLPDGEHYDTVPGTYWKDDKGIWWVHVPHHAQVWRASRLEGWKVTEHADRTITVEPSIHVVGYWHGFLTKGEFIDTGEYRL